MPEIYTNTDTVKIENHPEIGPNRERTVALIWTDTTKRITSCDAATQYLLGYSCEELAGEELKTVFLDKEPGIGQNDLRVKTKQGKFFDATVTFSIVRDGANTSTGFIARIERTTDNNTGTEPVEILANASPIGISIMQEGRIVFVNPQLQLDTGYSTEELLKTDIRSLVHPEDKATLDPLLSAPSIESTPLEYECRIVCREGEIKWMCIKNTSLDYQGKPSILSNFIDITERKLAEKEIQKLVSVVTHSSELVNLATMDGRMIFLNEAGSQMLGIDPDNVENTHITEVIPDALHGLVQNEVLPALLSKGSWEGDLRYRNLKTSEETDVHAVTFTIQNPSTGEPLYLANTSRNINNRKKAEAALRESEQRYRAIFENASDGIAYIDTKGNLIGANGRIEEITGYSREDLIGNDFFTSLISPNPTDKNISTHETAVNDSIPQPVPVQFNRKDGSTVFVETSPSIMKMEDGSEAILVVLRDVSMRQFTEQTLCESEERFRHMIEMSPFPIWILTSDGKIEFLNRRFTELFGYTSEDTPTIEAWLELAYPDPETRQQLVPHWNIDVSESSDGEMIKREFQLTTKNGCKKIVTARSMPLKDGHIYTVFHDITESELMRKSLRESEERFRTIFENANDEIIYLDSSGIVIDRNIKGEDILGYTFDEVQGKRITDPAFAMAPTQTSSITNLFHTAIEGEERQGLVELNMTHKNGHTVFAQASISKLVKDGNIEGLLVILRNITERVEAEAIIRKQAYDIGERLKELHCLYSISKLSQKPDITREDLIQSTVNLIPYAWEYPEITCARITVEDLVFCTEGFTETKWKLASKIMVNGNISGQVEVCYLREMQEKDEGPFMAEERELINTLAELLGTFIEYRLAEEQLRESEAKYSALVEQANDSVIIMQDESVVFVNKAHVDLTGYSEPELLSMPTHELVLPELRSESMNRYKARMDGYYIDAETETRIRCKDGTIKDLEVSTGLITFRGRPATMATLRDITERKLAEQEQRRLMTSLEDQNQIITASHQELREALNELERTNEELRRSQEQLVDSKKMAAIGELASGVAHEVNNPLMAISGHAQLLLEDVNNESMKESLDVILSETRRATDIVQNLLSFSRKQTPGRILTSLNQTIEDTLKLQAYDLKKNSIEFVTRLDPDIPLVKADPQQLKQVFLNIISNSYQAMKNSDNTGKLSIQTRLGTDDTLEVIFADDGPGIPSDIIDRIFEPFFTTKDVGLGTGLGLSICYGIIQSHEGTISVESVEGEGATFCIKLPAASDFVGELP